MKDSTKSLSKTAKHMKISPKSDHNLSTGKPGIEITPFEYTPQCLLHLSQSVTHFCQNCEYKPLCGLCLQEGNHKTHSVKNVEKTSKIVYRVLTETLITIRAKVNLLKILDEHVMSRQNEIRNQLKDYIQNVNNCFNGLENYLQEKKRQITNEIQNFYKNSAEKLIQAQQVAKQEIEKLQQMIRVLSEKADKLESTSVCFFYYEKKDILQATLEQGNSLYEELKGLAPDLKWIVQPEIIQPIKSSINNLAIHSNTTQIEFTNHNLSLPKKKSVIRKSKQKSLFKDKSEKKINYNTTGFLTPKHIDSSKIVQKLAKDIKQSHKLLTLASNDSLQKLNYKLIETPSMLLKKGKNKVKFEKNN